jgi:ABC-type transport system involved in multi-copper enzyme maturation permease subunit
LPSGSYDPTILYGVLAIAVVFGASTLILATRAGMRGTNMRGVWGILSFTFREAIRTKWLAIFAVIFFLLAADVPAKVLSDFNALPSWMIPSDFSAFSSAFPLIPLVALPYGAVSIVEDREAGTMQYLLSNPITKSEYFLGKIGGLLLATTAVIFIGFGAALVAAYASDVAQLSSLAVLMLTAALLNSVMLALALIISEVSKRKATAMGIAIFTWFLLAIVSGLDTLTYAVYWNIGPGVALSLILLDPVETSRIAAVVAANFSGTPQFGQSGFLALHFLGANFLSVVVGSVFVWLVFLMTVGFLVFRHQDAT